MLTKKKLQVASSISVIILVIIYFQYPSLQLDMYWDDYTLFKSYSFRELIRGFFRDMRVLNNVSVSAYRPMFQVMFHFAHTICGFDSYKLHIMVIVLQILQTIIAFLFFRLLTKRNSVSLASCLLFSLNPNLYWHFTWNTEIAAMSAMIPFLLSLISVIYYIRNPRNIIIFLHCFFAAWAYLTKETYAPLFFLTILTIIYYRKHDLRKYLPLVGCHMVIFITYLSTRFIILHGWGGSGVAPGIHSGIGVYLLNFWNYVRFLGRISLFDHYVSASPGYVLFYMGTISIVLIALTHVLTVYGKLNRKLLFFIFSVFLLPTYWVLTHINQLPDLLQFKPYIKKGYAWHPMLYKSFLFLYAIGFFTIFILGWVNRKSILNINEQPSRSLLLLEESSKNKFMKMPISEEIERLFRFFSYSVLFLLISGLPMLFHPESRLMNVTALGMGGIFASGFFIVLSMSDNKTHNKSWRSGKKYLLHYSLVIALILFVLSNGFIFKNKYTGPESIYNKSEAIHIDILTYMDADWYFQYFNLKEQRGHLFRKLVTRGLMDNETGKFNVEEVKSIPGIKDFMLDAGISESKLYDFQSADFKKTGH